MYSIDTGWACAGVLVKNGIITGGAPIFKKFYGQPIENLLKWKQVKQWQKI